MGLTKERNRENGRDREINSEEYIFLRKKKAGPSKDVAPAVFLPALSFAT